MKLKPAHYAWIGLTGYVLVAHTILISYEYKGREQFFTMSSAFRYSLLHPIQRWPVMLAWFLITFHLFSCFAPEKLRRLDPVSACATVIGQRMFSPVDSQNR